jgi:hypothetical protein
MRNLFIDKTMKMDIKRNNSLPAFRLSSGDMNKNQFDPGFYINKNFESRNSYGEG